MGHPSCRACKGSGSFYSKSGKRFDCKACDGRGVNRDLWESYCASCPATIISKYSQTAPTYCKNCRSKEFTKSCQQWGCTNTVRYKLGWTTIPDYCGHCQKMRSSGASARSCNGQRFGGTCDKLIWVPSGKNYTKCRDCSERERAEREEQWRTKACAGGCGNTIKYHKDWDKVPNLCKSCKEAEKAKWREKPCAGGCGNTLKYNVDWDHPPSFCKSCKEKQQRERESRLHLKSDGKNYRVENSQREHLATMGRCVMPPPHKTGQKAETQREYAQNGYWWLALPGKSHMTYIFREKPIQEGKLTFSFTDSVASVASSREFENIVTMYAIALLSE